MSVKLPRFLVVTLVVAGVLLLGLSTYLENAHLDLLARHPIYVNLLSGATGFCFGLLALSVVLSRILDRSQTLETEKRLLLVMHHFARHLTEIQATMASPSTYELIVDSGFDAATSRLRLEVDKCRISGLVMSGTELPDAAETWLSAWGLIGIRNPVITDHLARCRSSLTFANRFPSYDSTAQLIDDLDVLALHFANYEKRRP